MVEELLTILVVLTIGVATLLAARHFHAREEASLLVAGFFAHIVGVFVQTWVTREVYGGGDIEGYYRSGVELAHALRTDFAAIAPEAVKLFFHRDDAYLPFAVFGGSSATGSLSVVAAFLFFALQDSLYAASLVVALSAFFGKVAIFHALKDGLPRETHRRVLAGVTLVPSVVYWSSNLAKEAVILAFLGFVTLFLRTLVRGEIRVWQWALGAVFVLPVALIKPYVLLPFSVAAGVWYYWERTQRRGMSVVVKPAYLAIGAALALAGVVLIGRASPQFAVDNLARSTADIQAAGARVEGGSYYQLADPVEAEADSSLGRQLLLAPIALPTALFRPTLVEVRNPMMFLNALETTVLLFLVLRLLWRGGLGWLRRAVFENPTLMFCFAYTLMLGTAVGLASTNLGSLSRYRMPFMPFFVALVLVLDWTLMRARAGAPATRATDSPETLGQA